MSKKFMFCDDDGDDGGDGDGDDGGGNDFQN